MNIFINFFFFISFQKFVEGLAEFKRHPMVHADPLLRPFHGQACNCLPISGVSTSIARMLPPYSLRLIKRLSKGMERGVWKDSLLK